MTGLLRLLREGRVRSVGELVGRLEISQEGIRRQMEYLEHTGFLRRLDSMGRCAAGYGSAYGSGCTRGLGMFGIPVTWEVISKSEYQEIPRIHYCKEENALL